MKLRQSLALLLAVTALAGNAASGDGHATGACDHPATERAPASVAAIPDYAGGTDSGEVSDAHAEAAKNAWLAYHQSVSAALSHSADPKDLALATLVRRFASPLPGGGEASDDELLGRALALAPDDPLVLWIAIERSNRGANPWRDPALQRLREQEADNAAVWLEDLVDGTQAMHEDAARAALARMAGSNRYDGHFTDLLRAVFDAYQRFPVSDDLAATLSEAEKKASRETLAMTSALAVTAAVSFPGFQHLVNACRVNAASGQNLERSADCAIVGRLLAAHADTLIAGRIGLVVLRVSGSYGEDDLAAARVDDWVYDQYLSTVPTDEHAASLAQFATYHADWIETRSEIEAMRRAIARAGIAPTPPNGWVDLKSVFSEERLRQDQATFEHASAQR